MKPTLGIHGGAGVVSRQTPADKVELYRIGLKKALKAGFQILLNGGTALDATMEAVLEFERTPLYNAGRGAVYTNAASHEMDAAIMDGRDLNFGGVSNIRHIQHPILLARKVMDGTPHVLLSGSGAEQYAEELGFEFVENSFFDDDYRYGQLLKARQEGVIARDHDLHLEDPREKPKGTVGAAALDNFGNLAAATSTGGTTNKRCGRIGDTPIPGAGTFADNRSCAVSCTGYGEELMKKVSAYDLHSRMIYKGLSLKEAAREVVDEHLEPDSGGLIALDRQGNFTLVFKHGGNVPSI